MRNPLRDTLILALSLVAAACARPATPRPTPPYPAAPALVRRCAPQSAQGAQAARECYERAFLDVLHAADARAALEALDAAVALDPELRRDAHVYAHGIGIASFTTADEVAHVFARCTPAFQSGCYHGVIQAYFLDAGSPGAAVDSARLNALCRDYRGEGAAAGDQWLGFQCAHGVGHGLVMISARQLPRALEGCDLLVSDWEREACYGGAFMENIVGATDPHHGPSGQGAHDAAAASEHAHGEHDAHAGHAMSTAAFPPLDSADAHYPCSVVGERYQSACYLMQTSVVLQRANGNFVAARELCDTAPAAMRSTCYVSFGRDAVAYGDQQPRSITALCAVAAEEFRPWCHVGAAKNLIDRTSDPQDGMRYCAGVEAGAGRARCFEAVGEQIYVLERAPERRSQLCRSAPAADVAPCLRGADVVDVRTTSGAGS